MNEISVSITHKAERRGQSATDIEGQGSDKGFVPIIHRSLERG